MSAEALGFALASTLLFLAAGRISRETVGAASPGAARRRPRRAHRRARPAGVPRRGGQAQRAGVARPPDRAVALDLDGLGAVNKRLGHAVGDRVLVDAAETFEAALREGDVLGRLGGDEFAALVFSDDAHRIARRLIAAVVERAEGCSACAGVATAPRDGTGAEALLAAADVALRVAKRSSPGTVGVYDGMPISKGADGARAALERLSNGDGIWMAAQPIVDVRDGSVHAFEALARFSTRGAEGPLHWFALADEFGLRAELELSCLRRGPRSRARAAEGRAAEREPVGAPARGLADHGDHRRLRHPRPPDRGGHGGHARAPRRGDRRDAEVAARARRAVRRGRRGRRLLGPQPARRAAAHLPEARPRAGARDRPGPEPDGADALAGRLRPRHGGPAGGGGRGDARGAGPRASRRRRASCRAS